MTRFILAALVALMGTSAFAQRVGIGYHDDDWYGNVTIGGGYYYDDYWYDDHYWYDDRYYYEDRVAFSTHCAPEVVEGNVVKTDLVLRGLARSEEFANAEKFRTSVAKISQERNLDVKLKAYFDMLGIDARSNAQVAEFLGARRANPEWLRSLERNAGLTQRQADRVVTELSSALKGGLR